MATYVVLAKWTDKTFEQLKDAPAAVHEAKNLVHKLGAEIKAWYTLMGRFDEMCILEAPDDVTVARVVLAVGAKYGIRTETLRAFSIEEALKFIPAIP